MSFFIGASIIGLVTISTVIACASLIGLTIRETKNFVEQEFKLDEKTSKLVAKIIVATITFGVIAGCVAACVL